MLGKAGYSATKCLLVQAGYKCLVKQDIQRQSACWYKQVHKCLVQAGHSTPKCLSVQAGVNGGIVHVSIGKGFSSVSFSTDEKGGPWV